MRTRKELVKDPEARQNLRSIVLSQEPEILSKAKDDKWVEQSAL